MSNILSYYYCIVQLAADANAGISSGLTAATCKNFMTIDDIKNAVKLVRMKRTFVDEYVYTCTL